jgi:hypothetical protein
MTWLLSCRRPLPSPFMYSRITSPTVYQCTGTTFIPPPAHINYKYAPGHPQLHQLLEEKYCLPFNSPKMVMQFMYLSRIGVYIYPTHPVQWFDASPSCLQLYWMHSQSSRMLVFRQQLWKIHLM